MLWIEVPRHGRGAGQGRGEARPLFVSECHKLDAERRQRLHPLQRVDGEDRNDDTERAVVAAGIDHRVDVRAKNEIGRLPDPSPYVADLILEYFESDLAHPLRDKIRRTAMLG